MAEAARAWPDNDPTPSRVGDRRVRFFVDDACILCTVCSELAPENFRMAEAEDHDICFRQPTTPDQLEACRLALAECPAEAIGCEDQPWTR